MSETAPADGTTQSASDNLLSRLTGVIFSPQSTFERIVARPRWLGAMAVVFLILAGGQFLFLSTQKGQEAMFDQQVRQAEQWSGGLSDQQYQMYERLAPYNRYIVGVSTLVMGPIVSFLIAGVILGIFNAVLGGNASYAQVLAVVVHAGVVNLLQLLFTLPLNYLRGSMSSITNLGVFAQAFLDESNFLARFLGMMDLFIIWGIVVSAIGLAVLYRRRMAPIFWSLFGLYLVIGLGVAAFMAMRAASGGA
jgi:Yip1 domain